jgi:hypothetical protein
MTPSRDVTLLWHPEDVSEDHFKPLFVGLCRMILAGDCLLPKDSDWLATYHRGANLG